ncbi:MAG: hypothetical protein H6Q24_1462 [Bacteroidetes bacterium]|nr:hypothetical protein [Bacteroidota bacterium]
MQLLRDILLNNTEMAILQAINVKKKRQVCRTYTSIIFIFVLGYTIDRRINYQDEES